MKKILLILTIISLLYSCWNETDKQWIIEESEEILNDYVDTLEWSIIDAKTATDLMNQNQDKLKEAINNAK